MQFLWCIGEVRSNGRVGLCSSARPPPYFDSRNKWLHENFCLRQARDKTGLLTSAPSAVSGAILLVIGSRELKISSQHDSCIYCAYLFPPFPMPMTRYDKIGGLACFSSSAA